MDIASFPALTLVIFIDSQRRFHQYLKLELQQFRTHRSLSHRSSHHSSQPLSYPQHLVFDVRLYKDKILKTSKNENHI